MPLNPKCHGYHPHELRKRIPLELNTRCPLGYKHPLTGGLKIIFHILMGKVFLSHEHVTGRGSLERFLMKKEGRVVVSGGPGDRGSRFPWNWHLGILY